MAAGIWGLALLTAVPVFAVDLPAVGERVQDRLIARITGQCTLERKFAFDPALPKPQMPADRAYVVKGTNRVVLYDREDWYNHDYDTFGWYRTNGGLIGGVQKDDEWVGFQLPYAPGIQASIARIYVNNKPTLQHRCQNQVIHPKHFSECVDRFFETPLVNEICRMAGVRPY